MKAQVDARGVGRVELGTGDARFAQTVPQVLGKIPRSRHRHHAPDPAGLCAHRDQHRQDPRFYAESPGILVLHGLQPPFAVAVNRAVNADLAVCEVEVSPLQCLELAGTRSDVDSERDEPPPLNRHARALDELHEL